jgi:hypothetical protein
MATRTRAAAVKSKAAEPAPVAPAGDGPTGEPVEKPEPSIDEVINEGEPIVEIVTDEADEADVEGEVEPVAEAEGEGEGEVEAAVPATVALEAPAAKADPNGLSVPRPVGSNAQVTSEFQSAPAVTLRREYVDAATRQRVDPTAIFDRASRIGGSYTCTVRLVERLHFSDRDVPEGRLVLAKGAQTNAANVDHLIEHITAAHAEWEPEQG